MKNSLDFVRSFPEFSNIKEAKVNRDLVPPVYDVERSAMLNMIYAPDPETGLPSGDFAIYLGDKTSPEVREFIRLNLLHQCPEGVGLPKELEDDVAFDFIRGKDETPAMYCQRVSSYFQKSEEETK